MTAFQIQIHFENMSPSLLEQMDRWMNDLENIRTHSITHHKTQLHILLTCFFSLEPEKNTGKVSSSGQKSQ
jgi:hypothetical protein